MKTEEKQFLNLWDLKPKRNAEWEMTNEGKIVVLVPKFRNPFLVKYILPVLAKPFFRIKLDDVGTMIWQLSDGKTPVSSIADALVNTFGQSVDPVENRINHFLNQLERGDLIVIEHIQS